jgi:hypothetical protein
MSERKEKRNKEFSGFVAIFFTGFLLFGLGALAESSFSASQKIVAWGAIAVVIGLIGAGLTYEEKK